MQAEQVVHDTPRARATAILLFWMGIVLMGMVFVA